MGEFKGDATVKEELPLVDLSKQYPTFPPTAEQVIKNPEPIMAAAKLLIDEMSVGGGEYLFNHMKEKNWQLVANPNFSDLTKEEGMVSVATANEWVARTHGSGMELGYYNPTIVVQKLKGKYNQATPWVHFRKVYFEVDRFPKTLNGFDVFDQEQRDHLANLGFPVVMEIEAGTHARFIDSEVNHLRDQNVVVYDPKGEFLDRSVNHSDLAVPGILVRVDQGTRLYRGE